MPPTTPFAAVVRARQNQKFENLSEVLGMIDCGFIVLFLSVLEAKHCFYHNFRHADLAGSS